MLIKGDRLKASVDFITGMGLADPADQEAMKY
jgi:hypothetical protein